MSRYHRSPARAAALIYLRSNIAPYLFTRHLNFRSNLREQPHVAAELPPIEVRLPVLVGLTGDNGAQNSGAGSPDVVVSLCSQPSSAASILKAFAYIRRVPV
jgi:hypothetical protein